MNASDKTVSGRIDWIDIGRGVALVAMAIYHFSWDLEFFGYLAQGTAGTGPLKWFARSIASSFLILVGISLVLAHLNGIRWRPYFRRLAMVVAAAIAITVATYFFTPDAFVFFGILHHIALASVIALAFLRLPAVVVFALAAAWFAVPFFGKAEIFSQPALLWIGLSPVPPRTNDYVPLVPWFSMVLLGTGLAKLAVSSGVMQALAKRPPGRNIASNTLRFLGRHSLATYLLHQPILIGCVYLFSLVFPAQKPPPEESFFNSCHASCMVENEADFCTAFCGCAINGLMEEDLFEGVFRGEITQDSDPRVAEISRVCSFEAANDDD
jgi:uncharacterized membrane protein